MKFMHFFRKLCAFFMAIILFCILLVTMLLITTRNLITKDNLASYIKDANILDMKANTLLDIGPEGKEITLREKISNMALEVGIPKDIVSDILESRELTELLGEYFSGTIDYVLNGGEKPSLSQDTIDKIKQAALESSEKHINITLENEILEEYIETYTDDLRGLLPERGYYIGNGHYINDLKQFLNLNSLYLYLAMAIVVVFIILFTWSLYKPLQYVSIVMILSGFLFVAVGSADGILNGFIISKVTSMQAIISPLITNVLTLWFKCGVIVSFSGMFLLIIYAAISRVMKHSIYRKLEN